MAESSVLVAGLVRNCERTVESDVERIGAALRGFASVRWLLIESDSDDSTLECLERLSRKVAGFSYLSLGHLRPTMPQRTVRIAHCRNAFLERFRTDPLLADAQFLAIADLDGVNDLLDDAAVASCWERDDWDVVTANQRGPYYDVWTLRHAGWCPGDCWAQNRFLRAHGVDRERARYASIYSKMLVLGEKGPWIEVDSAFGGFAIYRRDALLEGRYVGVDGQGHEVSDHVELHRTLRERGKRIFVNPRLVNAAYTQHSIQLSNYTFIPGWSWRRAVKRIIGKELTAFVYRLTKGRAG